MDVIRKLLLSLFLVLGLSGCIRPQHPEPTATPYPPLATVEPSASAEPTATSETQDAAIAEDVQTDEKDEVALYLYTWHHLPDNFMTKKEARAQGWDGGPLWKVVEGMCIGGDVYSNFEGVLPKKHQYHECDIDSLGYKSRGSRRIVWNEEYDIWYTGDHYESFTLLYGDGK